MSQQLPDPQSLDALVAAFERLQGTRSDPVDAMHRRGLETRLAQLAGYGVVALLVVSSWIAVDPLGRYRPEQREQGLQALGAVTAALVGAIGGYAAKR